MDMGRMGNIETGGCIIPYIAKARYTDDLLLCRSLQANYYDHRQSRTFA